MLDDGTILFLANYVYTYSLYARTHLFSIGLLFESIWPLLRYLKPKVGAYAAILQTSEGPGLTWRELWKNRPVKQTNK